MTERYDSRPRPLGKWDNPMCKCDNCGKPKGWHTPPQANNCKQAMSMRA